MSRGKVAVGGAPRPLGPPPELRPVPYDTARANALLAEAGWVDRDGDGVRESAGGQALRVTLKIPAGIDFSREAAEVVRGDVADFRLDLRDPFHTEAVGQPFQLSSWSSPEATGRRTGWAPVDARGIFVTLPQWWLRGAAADATAAEAR